MENVLFPSPNLARIRSLLSFRSGINENFDSIARTRVAAALPIALNRN
ncbi:hypothetical protein [Nostoc sp.]